MNESPNDEAELNNKPSAIVPVPYNETAGRRNTGTCVQPDISMKLFLDFLATAYRVNDALENYPLETFKKSNVVDWNQLNSCSFVSVLFQNNVNNKQTQRRSGEQTHDTLTEEIDSQNGSSKTNLLSQMSCDNVQSFESYSSDKLEDEGRPLLKHSVKRGEKHRRGRSASLGGNRGEKRLDKRRSSFAKRESQDSKGKVDSDVNFVERQIKRKLSEVLQEGILDSVLPYVIPKQTGNISPKKPPSGSERKNCLEKTGSTVYTNQNKDDITVYHSRKPNCLISEHSRDSAKDVEVEIHVCDEVKNMKKDFRCSQKLLVSKMGYFAEVTTGQKLEDMDISVHCDITIFEWLMRWVKKDSTRPELAPQLDAANVIPVLVSAAFLQMDPLLNDCLTYCQEHMNEILRLSTNLSCLNDSIITRLASQFTNVEVEEMRDKRDKLQSRLFCKLITFLGEPEPNHKRGHFASLADMFECGYCGKLLPQSLSIQVPCRPSNNRINSLGQVQGIHVRNGVAWSVTEWIKQVRSELGCWREVYWRLWAQSHWLLCSVCHNYYPVSQADWCSHHPDMPQFFIMEHHRTMSFPIGRFPCCGERAYRFEVLQNSNGCSYRAHTPVVDSSISLSIQKILQTYRHVIALEPPLTVFPERLTRLVRSNRDSSNVDESKDCVPNTSLWWHGLQLAPYVPKTVLISRIWEKPKEPKARINWVDNCEVGSVSGGGGQLTYSEVSGSSENANSSPDDTEHDSSPSLGEDNSEDSLLCNSPVPKTKKKTCSPFVYCPNQPNQWLARYSTRYNQDSLRDYEEWSLSTVVSLLSHRHGDSYHRGSRGKWGPHITPLGGTYVRLEAQWREGHLHLYQGGRVPVTTNTRGRHLVSSRARPRSNLR